MSNDTQRTLAGPVSYTGQGLFTGETTTITMQRAPVGAGLRFVRTDLPGRPEVQVATENAQHDSAGLRRTVLSSGGAEVHTVEHVLAAATGMGIDNLLLELDGMEVPEPEDGSGLVFARLIRDAGIEDQGIPRSYLTIREPVSLHLDGGVQLLALPDDGLRLSFTIQYDAPAPGTQHLSLLVTPESFFNEIAPARTFGFREEIEALRASGQIRGGTLNNAVVFDGDGVVNEGGLRFPDEPVRHKLLDLLGDLALLGRPLRGHISAVRSGHASNIRFVRRIMESFGGGGTPGHEDLLDKPHFDITAIQKIMPHRYPLLLVDRILLLEDRRRVIGLKNVTVNEPFFVGHFPGHPIMPAVLVIEAMAQVGGVLLLSTVTDPESKLVYFMGIDNARFRRPVLPGDQVIFELELVRLKGRICKMHGRGFVRGALVAEADLLSTVVDR